MAGERPQHSLQPGRCHGGAAAPLDLVFDMGMPYRLTMAERTALRLDEQAESDLKFLVGVYGTQTAAVKSALSVLARKERLFANMRDFIAETEAESGQLTEAELEVARQYF